MRASSSANGLKVHAVAGTYVVLFGFDLPQADCRGLRGFAIHRVDHTDNEAYYLEGMKAFIETDPGFPAGELYSTKDHPIQSFQWADYAAKPGHDYTYTITALKGPPANLAPHSAVEIDITTESLEDDSHAVYFNRGVAASQAYVRRFGDREPAKVRNGQAFVWLSRGLYEALVDYIRKSIPGKHSLRIAAYEFHYEPLLQVIRDTINRGVDVKIIFDARQEPVRTRNRTAIANAGLGSHCLERNVNPSAIAHNKFIVKLNHSQPVSVWTGGTNFSDGGIFGHSNVAHVVEEPSVADKFSAYWEELATDPPSRQLRTTLEQLSPLPPRPPPVGTLALFSPRSSLGALDWYAAMAKDAREGLLMTFAFGMNDIFKDVYRTSAAPFRLALLESKTRPMKTGSPERKAEEKAIQQLRNMPENTFAIGSLIVNNEIDGWVKEGLSGLNSRVRYIHNKFMLIDPLSDDPIIIAGSANFSAASTTENDENMLIVRGNTRVADVYLGEFMRLYSHHAFRESLQFRRVGDPKPLSTGRWWADYFGDTERSVRRRFFARS